MFGLFKKKKIIEKEFTEEENLAFTVVYTIELLQDFIEEDQNYTLTGRDQDSLFYILLFHYLELLTRFVFKTFSEPFKRTVSRSILEYVVEMNTTRFPDIPKQEVYKKLEEQLGEYQKSYKKYKRDILMAREEDLDDQECLLRFSLLNITSFASSRSLANDDRFRLGVLRIINGAVRRVLYFVPTASK